MVAATVGVTALIASLGVGVGVAGAVPADPATGYPSWNNGVVNGIRDTGSDTTFYMMQKIGDLYTSAGLYGCTLNAAAGQALFNAGFTSTSANEEYYCRSGQNTTTSDTADNWSRTEVTEGVDDVGSGAGQNQLCGSSVLSSPLTVNFARSSKPEGTACGDLQETGYAKDGVPAVAFQINPSSYGTPAAGSPYAAVERWQHRRCCQGLAARRSDRWSEHRYGADQHLQRRQRRWGRQHGLPPVVCDGLHAGSPTGASSPTSGRTCTSHGRGWTNGSTTATAPAGFTFPSKRGAPGNLTASPP